MHIHTLRTSRGPACEDAFEASQLRQYFMGSGTIMIISTRSELDHRDIR